MHEVHGRNPGRPRRPLIPLVGHARTPLGKTLIILVGIALALGFGAVVDRTMGAPAPAHAATVTSPARAAVLAGPMKPPDDQVNYRWHPPKSRPLPKHTIRWKTKNQYGDIVPHARRGHQFCPKGSYLVQSKYTGISCASTKTAKRARKAVVRCSGYVVIGYVWGKVPGAAGAASACVFDLLTSWL